MNIVAKQTITAAGGAQTISMKDWKAQEYTFSFRSVGATPLAGTTAVAATPMNGTSEPVTDQFGSALNINPTALRVFKLAYPLESVTITPSSWTAGSAIEVTVLADSPLSI